VSVMTEPSISKSNADRATVNGFGDEWARFDQTELPAAELQALFDAYFSVFPWRELHEYSQGFDLGCGSGRWARLVAPRVGRLHCIDPSAAIDIARRNLSHLLNCEFHRATVDAMPLHDGSMDFGYSLGVLHHVPDTQAGIHACVAKLKIGAPFLIYLYYAFDNRPWWFRQIWRFSDVLRSIVSRCPHGLRYFLSQCLAFFVYWPLARASRTFERIGVKVGNWPLSAYRHRSFYTMRTDALDRFGTRLEKRFSRAQVISMLEAAGLERVEVSATEPFWCAVGYRRPSSEATG
jgi:SAM-dependent methyltransferase